MKEPSWRRRYAEGLKVGRKRACPASDEGIDLSAAYALLAEVPRSHEDIRGYKGALTTIESQSSFGTTEPALGILLEGMEIAGGTVNLSEFNRGAIETEVGIVLAEDIQDISQLDDIYRLIRSCHLMIELVDLNFEVAPTLADLVMNNAAAKQYLLGPEIALEMLSGAKLELRKDRDPLYVEKPMEREEILIDALSWMLRQALSIDLPVRAGQVWMAGAMGPIHALQAGKYEFRLGADLDCASCLTFDVA